MVVGCKSKLVEAIISGLSYKDTVLMISYDGKVLYSFIFLLIIMLQALTNTLGKRVVDVADHVTPFHSPNGTGGE